MNIHLLIRDPKLVISLVSYCSMEHYTSRLLQEIALSLPDDGYRSNGSPTTPGQVDFLSQLLP